MKVVAGAMLPAVRLPAPKLPPARVEPPRRRLDAGVAQNRPDGAGRDHDAEPDQLALDPPATLLGSSAQPPTGPNPEGNPTLGAGSLAARASQPTAQVETSPKAIRRTR
jgi:hypothetical protein